MANSWTQPDGGLEVSLAREDRPNRPTMITVADRSMNVEILMQPHEVLWLIDRLEDALTLAAEHH